MSVMKREGCAGSTGLDVAGGMDAQIGSGMSTNDSEESWLRRGLKILACITANKSKCQ